MESRGATQVAANSFLDVPLNALRRGLGSVAALSRPVRSARAIVHFGPWRRFFRQAIRRLKAGPHADFPAAGDLFRDMDVASASRELDDNSVFLAGAIPARLLDRLRAMTDLLPVGHYERVHEVSADVREIAEDPNVIRLLTDYFGCSPELLESTIVVTAPFRPRSAQNYFHFDYAGWQSLNLFVYLTDVTERTAPHEVAQGSHREITLRDAARGLIADDEALRRFGSRVRTVVGPAGTAFFENTEAFHRRASGADRRVMLNLLFASHRGLLSRGRTSSRHLKRRAMTIRALGAR